ncbi:MAG TPA: protein kinase [Kofleriaceae bacterium]|nr:protein kinase [Kofleriaceae bacterium]
MKTKREGPDLGEAETQRAGLGDSDVARLRSSIQAVPDEATFGGRFDLQGQAGSGGMGLVYEAIDRDSGRRVAIKVITGLPSPDDHARFASEAEALERLDHPAIVDYVTHGETSRGEPYIAMEWLVGESLQMRLAHGALPVAEAVVMAERIADALAHAHAHGIVHRDLKPSNIFLVDGKPEQAHLIDFGVAKLADRDLTNTGQMIGTPGYMAPEQVRGEKTVDRRADLFALGCVLYRALAGRAPFEGAEVMEVLARLLLEHPPAITELVPDVPPRLAHLIGSLLAKDPASRLGDAAIARDELVAIGEALVARDARALGHLPSEVPTPPPHDLDTFVATPRGRSAYQRTRTAITIAAIAGVLALVAVLVTVISMLRREPADDACTDAVRAGCRAACDRDDADACLRLAETLHDNNLGIPIDHEAARAADTKACRLGKAAGCRNAAISHFATTKKLDLPAGDPRRIARLREAERLMQQACDRDDFDACRRLGKEYSQGYGQLVPDPAKAFALVEKACRGKNAAACNALFDMVNDPNNGATPELREGARRVRDEACAQKIVECP